jgi:hypothetical protein
MTKDQTLALHTSRVIDAYLTCLQYDMPSGKREPLENCSHFKLTHYPISGPLSHLRSLWP